MRSGGDKKKRSRLPMSLCHPESFTSVPSCLFLAILYSAAFYPRIHPVHGHYSPGLAAIARQETRSYV